MLPRPERVAPTGIPAWVGTEETAGTLLVADLYIRPDGAVIGEHIHPALEERFTVRRGRVGFRLDGHEDIAILGRQLMAPAGVAHDWWKVGDEEAHVVVEIRPAARFEEMIRNTYGLTQDGKTDAKGMPSVLQLALLAREFGDTIRFTKPPRIVQRVLFSVLAPVARRRGLRGSYPKYLSRPPLGRVAVEPWTRPPEDPASPRVARAG